jgi:hypothetical protein
VPQRLRLIVPLLLATGLALVSCSSAPAQQRVLPKAAAAATACTSAAYHFDKPVMVKQLTSLTSAHTVRGGHAIPDDERQVMAIRSWAQSSAGDADAKAAYRAYLAAADRGDFGDDALTNDHPLGTIASVPRPEPGTLNSHRAARLASYSETLVWTAHFRRSCAHGPSSTGTVVAWTEDGGGMVQCGLTAHLTPVPLLAEEMACDEHW